MLKIQLTLLLVLLSGASALAISPPARSVASVSAVTGVTPADLTPFDPEAPALYELGLGIGGTMDRHYPGSDQTRLVALPFPFGIYRGEIIQSDRGGTRARLMTATNFDVSVSASGAFPLKSSEDVARTGMPDIGWTGQLGPKLRLQLRNWDDGAFLRAGLSARAAFSANDFSSVMGRGFVYEAEVVYERPNTFNDQIDFFSALSSSFGSEKYLDYLYTVPAAYATAGRTAYQAHPGLLESSLEAGFSYRTLNKKHKFVISGQAGTLEGSSNLDSPLVKSRVDLTLAFAWVWTFFESKERAARVD